MTGHRELPGACHGFGCDIYELGRIVCNVWLRAKRWHCLVVAVVRCVFAFPRLPRSAGFDGVCSLAGARRTLPSLPLLVPSSALLFCSANKSLFLSHSFFYSLCSRLSWRGKTFPQLSQSPSPHPPHPLPFSLTPSFSSLVPFLHPTPLLLLFHSLFCHFLCPLLPSDCLSSLPFIFAFSPSIPPPLFLSPPFPGTNWRHMMPIPTCAQTQPHSHTQTPTCMCIYHRVADVFHSAL